MTSYLYRSLGSVADDDLLSGSLHDVECVLYVPAVPAIPLTCVVATLLSGVACVLLAAILVIGLLLAQTYSSSRTTSILAWAATLLMPSVAMMVGPFWTLTSRLRFSP